MYDEDDGFINVMIKIIGLVWWFDRNWMIERIMMVMIILRWTTLKMMTLAIMIGMDEDDGFINCHDSKATLMTIHYDYCLISS